MREAIVEVDDLTIYRTDGVSTGGVRESVLLPLKSVKGELIRCKDCKYWWKDAEPYSISICNRSELCMGENDYCSLAERKEE